MPESNQGNVVASSVGHQKEEFSKGLFIIYREVGIEETLIG